MSSGALWFGVGVGVGGGKRLCEPLLCGELRTEVGVGVV